MSIGSRPQIRQITKPIDRCAHAYKWAIAFFPKYPVIVLMILPAFVAVSLDLGDIFVGRSSGCIGLQIKPAGRKKNQKQWWAVLPHSFPLAF